MPIQFACDECLAEYSVRDDMAGKRVRCKNCTKVLEIPDPFDDQEPSRPTVQRGYAPEFNRDLFLMKQKRLTVQEKYYVYDDRERPILFIERPRHWLRHIGAMIAGLMLIGMGVVLSIGLGMALGNGNGRIDNPAAGITLTLGLLISFVGGLALIIALSPKRHITVYPDENRDRVLLEIYQDRKLALWSSSFTVADPRDGMLGRCEKVYIYNFLRKRWYIFNPQGELYLVVNEDSLILSLMRRLMPPILMIFFGRTNFIIHEPRQKQVLGEFNRKFTLFDEYVLDMTGDPDHLVDRRMAIAIGVLLDTGERR